MVFSTHLFIFYFLPLVLLLNYSLPFRCLSFTLTLMSYIFYGWANPVWVLLMLFSSYVDFLCGLALVRYSGEPMGAAVPMGQALRKLLPYMMCLGLVGYLAGWVAWHRMVPDAAAAAAWAGWPYAFGAFLALVFAVAVWFGGGFLLRSGPELPILPQGRRRTRGQKLALAMSMISNLSILGFFKYFDFCAESINDLSVALGLGEAAANMLHVALPVGISFYTFESMSYAIDVYRGHARAMRNPIDYQFFVADFPHLVAGPIIRYHTVAEQIRCRVFTYEKFARGVAFFCMGLAKKILLANPMGYIADRAFAAEGLHWYDAWYGVISYAFQIYFDFSAYSDMAVGLGLFIGILFMKNFNDPYLSDSITDYWRRWHISLSTWLRDYLYIPLGGNRKGEARTYINLLLVMFLGGMWHGAAWNFIIWGCIHGGMLAFERLQGKNSPYRRLPAPFRIGITFFIVCLAWVFFRADTLPLALGYLKSLFGLQQISLAGEALAGVIYTPYHLGMFAVCAFVVWALPQVWVFTQKLTALRAAVCLGAFLLSLIVMWTQTENPFLYFQF